MPLTPTAASVASAAVTCPHCKATSLVEVGTSPLCTCGKRIYAFPAGPDPTVDHPAHYGGADDPFEAIKVIDAWGLGFCLGNAVKYIARHHRKGAAIRDLKKARWYLNHEIERLENKE